MSMDSFLQQASQALRQLEAVQVTQGVSSGATAPATFTSPVNPTPEGGGQQQPPSSQPSIKRLAITSIMPASCFGSQNPGSPTPPLEASDQGLGMAPNDQKMGLGAKMATSAPSLPSQARELGLGPEEGLFPIAYALLDSGATHPTLLL